MEAVMVKKIVTVCEQQWEERQETFNVCRMVPEEVVSEHRCTVMVPSYTDEPRTITCYQSVPRMVEREITCCRTVPVCVTDCCGCCHTQCQVIQEVRKVQCCVYDCVAVQKQITVRVCHYTPTERVYTTKCIVCKPVTEAVTRTVRYCKLVPVQKEITVCEYRPVACAAPAPCSTCGTCNSCDTCSSCSSCYSSCGGCSHHHHCCR